MNKRLRIILLSLVGVFIIAQFIPVNRPVNDPPANYDFFKANNINEDVKTLLRDACFNCHSQEVIYPWYAHMAPVSWLVASDVRHGRANLDFSNWTQLSKREKLDVLDEIGDEVNAESMPLPIYTIMHAEARLTSEQRKLLVSFANNLADKVFEE